MGDNILHGNEKVQDNVTQGTRNRSDLHACTQSFDHTKPTKQSLLQNSIFSAQRFTPREKDLPKRRNAQSSRKRCLSNTLKDERKLTFDMPPTSDLVSKLEALDLRLNETCHDARQRLLSD